MGALTDSSYEYYVKEHLLLHGADKRYEKLYTDMVESAKKHLIFRPLAEGDPDILFSGSAIHYDGKLFQEDNEVQHLGCFIGGMFALGGKIFNRPQDVEMAAKLTQGCVWAYNATRSGVMPESFHIRRCPVKLPGETEEPACHFNFDTVDDETEEREQMLLKGLLEAGDIASLDSFSPVSNNYKATTEEIEDSLGGMRWPVMGHYDLPRSFLRMDGRYLLRPEALESVFYMYRVSGDKLWQNQGWDMFKSIISLTKVTEENVEELSSNHKKNVKKSNADSKAVGFSAVNDVSYPLGDPENLSDESESFWMAETLKYAYLLFSEPSLISLDDYVFNTEAHPVLRPDASFK